MRASAVDECLRRAAAYPTADFSGLADRGVEFFRKARDAEHCRAIAELWEKLGRTDPGSLYNAARYRVVTAAARGEEKVR